MVNERGLNLDDRPHTLCFRRRAVERCRQSGASAGITDKLYVGPGGKVFHSVRKVEEHLSATAPEAEAIVDGFSIFSRESREDISQRRKRRRRVEQNRCTQQLNADGSAIARSTFRWAADEPTPFREAWADWNGVTVPLGSVGNAMQACLAAAAKAAAEGSMAAKAGNSAAAAAGQLAVSAATAAMQRTLVGAVPLPKLAPKRVRMTPFSVKCLEL